MKTKPHPKHDGILVRDDGCIYIPAKPGHVAHWTYGYPNAKGYLCVGINRKMYKVHKLVAETFLDNPDGLPTVDHIDRDKNNNRVENLRYASFKTQADNTFRVESSVTKYGIRKCDDVCAYIRSRRKVDPIYAENQRECARAWRAKMKRLGYVKREIDGKQVYVKA